MKLNEIDFHRLPKKNLIIAFYRCSDVRLHLQYRNFKHIELRTGPVQFDEASPHHTDIPKIVKSGTES